MTAAPGGSGFGAKPNRARDVIQRLESLRMQPGSITLAFRWRDQGAESLPQRVTRLRNVHWVTGSTVSGAWVRVGGR